MLLKNKMNNSKIFITATLKKDGLGSQIISKILCMIYCKKNKYKYIHTPLLKLDVRDQDETGKKAYKNGEGNKWINKWENLLNIGFNHTSINNIKYDHIISFADLINEKQIKPDDNYLKHNFDPTDRINYYVKKYPNKKILFEIKEFPKIDKYNYEDYKDIINNIRTFNNIDNSKLDKTKINISMHIRHSSTRDNRHNLLKDWNKNNFKELILRIKNKLKNYNLQFHIISDGTKENFPEYEFIDNNLANLKNTNIKNIKMYLSTDSMQSFSIMVKSQILVMGTSAFSYLAGLFNSNFVIYPEFHDKPIKDWFEFENNEFEKMNLYNILNNKLTQIYSIDRCRNINLNYFYKNNLKLLIEKPYENFIKEYLNFEKNLIKFYKENRTYIIFDEDYYIYKNKISKLKDVVFNENLKENNYICIEVLKHNLLDKYNELYPKNIISGNGLINIYKSNKKPIPSEFIYGIVSNKLIFKYFKNSIGLIGVDEKLKIIMRLMKHKEYQEYLGLNEFTDYINIPNKIDSSDINKIRKYLKSELSNTKSKIFLVSIGNIKSYLFNLLKNYKTAIFIDIGFYIDAIAGIIDYRRPFAADWINYKLKDYDYSKINNLKYETKLERYL